MLKYCKPHICSISFWGSSFLLLLLFGFNVSIRDLISIALSGKIFLSIYSWFFLASPLIYLLSVIIRLSKKDMFTLIDKINQIQWENLTVPYLGFDILDFILSVKYCEGNRRLIIREIQVYISHLVSTISWWGLVFFGVYTIYRQRPNAILTAIEAKSGHSMYKLLAVVLAIYIALNFINWGVRKAIIKFIYKR